jgi:hypothetical protein
MSTTKIDTKTFQLVKQNFNLAQIALYNIVLES